MFYLIANPEVGPCHGHLQASCCELKHSITLRGRTYKIPCDKDKMFQLLDTMHEAKIEELAAQQSTHLGILLTAAALTILMRTTLEVDDLRLTLLQRLHRHFGEDAGCDLVFTATHFAVLTRDVRMLKDLITDGRCEPLAVVASTRTSPLIHCAILGNMELAEALMASELVGAADINAHSGLGYDMLMHASQYGHVSMVQRLLSWRACVNSQAVGDADAGMTPLQFAALQGHAECCQILLQSLADVGLKNVMGATALHMALKEPLHAFGSDAAGTNQAIRLLLAARSSPEEQDNIGQTPLALSRLAAKSRNFALSPDVLVPVPERSASSCARLCWCLTAEGGRS